MPPACRNCSVENATRSTPMVDTHCGSKVWPGGEGRANSRTARRRGQVGRAQADQPAADVERGRQREQRPAAPATPARSPTRAVMKPSHSRAKRRIARQLGGLERRRGDEGRLVASLTPAAAQPVVRRSSTGGRRGRAGRRRAAGAASRPGSAPCPAAGPAASCRRRRLSSASSARRWLRTNQMTASTTASTRRYFMRRASAPLRARSASPHRPAAAAASPA